MSTIITTYSVGVLNRSAPATQIVWPDGIDVLIWNIDPTDTAFIGDNNAIQATDQNGIVPLGPGQSVSVDGKTAIFAAAASGKVVEIAVIPGGSGTPTIGAVTIGNTPNVNINGTPTVDIGSGNVTLTGTSNVNVTNANIDVVGSGGFVSPGNIASLINDAAIHTLALAGGVYTTPVQDVRNFLSYTLRVSAFCGSQGTANAPLTMEATVQYWADAAGTIPLYRERWEFWLGNSAGNASDLLGSGPVHGPFMNITFFNPGATATSTIQNIQLWGTQRSLTRSDWRQVPPTGISSGLTQITPGSISADGADNNLAFLFGVPLAANGTFWQPLPLFAGPIYVRLDSSTTLAHNFGVYNGSGLLNGTLLAGPGGPGMIWNVAGTAVTEYEATIIAPRTPLYIVAAAGASPPAFTFMAIGQQL